MIRFQGFDVQVSRKAGCRRMILRAVKGGGCFSLTVPPGVNRQTALAFLEAHRDWMEAHARLLHAWQPRYERGERHWVRGVLLTLGEAGTPAGADFLIWRQRQLEDTVRRNLQPLAAKTGRQPASVSFRDMRTRWGSCTPATGRIRLSTRLGCAPEEWVCYVLAHELCHLLVPDHSTAFYREMERVCPEWRVLRQKLNQADFSPLPPLAEDPSNTSI